MITTARLELIPATADMLRAALAGPDALAVAIEAEVPPSWPPEYLDDDAFRYMLNMLEGADAGAAHLPATSASANPGEWLMYFIILTRRQEGRLLIGSAGYKGPPNDDGTVEVGYGIVSDQRRRGYASEAVRGLLRQAFKERRVRRVIAETYPELVGSLGVLATCGFQYIGEGSEPDIVRFELLRKDHGGGESDEQWKGLVYDPALEAQFDAEIAARERELGRGLTGQETSAIARKYA